MKALTLAVAAVLALALTGCCNINGRVGTRASCSSICSCAPVCAVAR